MSFLQERETRRFFQMILAVSGVLLLLPVGFGLFFGRQLRAALLERELTLTAALLERGVPAGDLAAGLRSLEGSAAARTLLQRLGRAESTPFWQFADIRRQAGNVLAMLLWLLPPVVALLWGTVRYLSGRNRLYEQATVTVARFAAGDFREHLPHARAGALYHLFAAAEQLATALQAKGEAERRSKEFLKSMISDISHQLKTPLAALQMYAEIIGAEPGNETAVRTFTEKSAASLRRMEGLIGALLKIARLDAGSIVFAPQRVLAADLALRAAEGLQTRAAREGKRLALRGSPELALVCDPDWTAEAVGNLIKNALDHTAAGDEITVSWEQSPAMFRLAVSDTGEGIAEADIHHIFKRFYRSPTARGTQGVGLGLPLARAVIEGQGGLLTVQSVPREGAVFTISFTGTVQK